LLTFAAQNKSLTDNQNGWLEVVRWLDG